MPRLEIDWSPGEGDVSTGANVYYRVKGGASKWVPAAYTTAFRVVIDFPTTYETIEIAVAPVAGGIEANEEDWAVVEYTPALKDDITVPDDVSSFGVGQQGNLISCRWGAVTPQPHHYEIRLGSTWATGVKMQTPPGSSTSTTFGWGTSGSQTYMIKAVDAAGNESSTATSRTLTVQSSQYEVTTQSNDEQSGGFTGTKTGTEVSGGALFIEKAPTAAQSWTDVADTYTWPPMFPHLSSGTYVTAADDAGSVVYEKIDINLTLAKDDPGVTADGWAMICRPAGNVSANSRTALDRIYGNESLVGGYEYTVEIDTTPDDPAGTPTWDGWRVWVPEAVYRYRGVRLRITLISRWFFWFKLTGFTWKRRRQNRKDEQTVSVVATGGTTVTWSTTFTSAPKVTATVITNSALFAVVDTISTTEAKVYVFNSSGTEQSSGTVHVQALGV